MLLTISQFCFSVYIDLTFELYGPNHKVCTLAQASILMHTQEYNKIKKWQKKLLLKASTEVEVSTVFPTPDENSRKEEE